MGNFKCKLATVSLVISLLVSAAAHAITTSATVTVTMLDLAAPTDGLYVTAASSWGCGGTTRVRVPASNPMFKEMLSLFMMAHATGKRVEADLNCNGDSSEVVRLRVKD